MQTHPERSTLGPLEMLYVHRGLIWEFVCRDFSGRYRGSFLGMAWSLLHPLVMLVIYTIVFSVAFKAKWGIGEESKVAFALILFSGMIVHGFFAECLNRAPSLVVGQPNFVKKVLFPLEILPCVTVCSASLHFAVSFAVLIIFCVMVGVPVHWSTLLSPVILLPLVLLTLGLTWILASLGVYLRDLAQVIGMVTTVALFLAPIFYPLDALPAAYRAVIAWNPITLPVSQLRDAMLWGRSLNWFDWAVSLGLGLFVFLSGYWWFQNTRRGFADVL